MDNVSSQRSLNESINTSSSVKLFNDNVSLIYYSVNDMQFPFYDHQYYFNECPCLRYIFLSNKTIVFKDHCPGDYTITGILGNYEYKDSNFIEVFSDSLRSNYYIFIDRLQSRNNDESKLNFEILNENLEKVGNILTVYYTRRPTFLNKKKSISLKHDDLNIILNKKVKIEEICIEDYIGKERKVFYIPVKWKVKPKAITYSIILRKHGINIKFENNKIFFYQWKYESQNFEKVGELIYKMD